MIKNFLYLGFLVVAGTFGIAHHLRTSPSIAEDSAAEVRSEEAGCIGCTECGADPVVDAEGGVKRVLEEPLDAWVENLEREARGLENQFSLTLPDGTVVGGELWPVDPERPLVVQGRLSEPSVGTLIFVREEDVAGAPVSYGTIVTRDGSVAWTVESSGLDGEMTLVETELEAILCGSGSQAGIAKEPLDVVIEEEQILLPEDHPPTGNHPDYQPTVPALESRPGALGVLFLDFDGGRNSDVFWGTFNVAHSGKSASDITDIWMRVAEDFFPFDLNVTTDQAVYEAAQNGRRQRCYITNTRDAIGNAGGIAVIHSYKLPDDFACWALPYGNDNCALVISHEFGHTLGLGHDGHSGASYSRGFGSGSESWGPIMGAPYGKSISIWNNGDYADANNSENDLTVIAANPGAQARIDAIGNTIGTAEVLRCFADGTIFEQDVIETRTDKDVYAFRTTGGDISVSFAGAAVGMNMNSRGTIYDSTGAVVVTDNHPSNKNVVLNATLAAGDYYLEMDGDERTGSNPFSDYGVLGAFKLRGTIEGLVAPDYFAVPEGSPLTTVVGTVSAWETHATAPTFTLTGGNDDNLFTVNPTNGEITVSNNIDYETLYTDWRYPPFYYLRVTISSGAVTEERTVFVEIIDLNEAPVIVSTFSETVLKNTVAGTELGRVVAEDTDSFSPVVYAITGGDPGGIDPYFAIDANSGVVSTARGIDLTPQTVNLTVTASDTGSPPLTASTTVTLEVIDIPAGFVPGTLAQLFYYGVPGDSMADLYGAAVYPGCPEALEFPTEASYVGFEENHGSVMTGHFLAPTTGSYQFWIAADDVAELYISTDDDPANLPVVANASVLTWTEVEGYDESPTQVTSTVPLLAGQAYYFEARMKKGSGGGAHLSVAWQRPLGSREVVPGRFLSPIVENYGPSARNLAFDVRLDAFPGFPVGNLDVVDPNAGDTLSSLTITAGDPGGVFSLDLAGGLALLDPSGLPVAGSEITLTVEATDNHGASCSADVVLAVGAADAITTPGLDREMFWEISGTKVNDLTGDVKYPCHPDESRYLTQLVTAQGLGEQYGSRIRTILTPTVSGTYRFYVSGDDQTNLYLGTDATAGSAVLLAQATPWTGFQQWDKYPAQESGDVTLTAGQDYYLEVLHKEGGGGDHFAVGWVLPGGSEVTLIPGAELAPFDTNCPPVLPAPATPSFASTVASGTGVVTLAGSDPEGEQLTYAILSGNEGGLFVIDPASGELSTAAEVGPGCYPLEVAAQDRGRGGVYPLAEASTTFDVVVGPATYEAFATAIWGAGYASLPRTAPGEDFDHDGLSNAMEFLLVGENPTARRTLQDMLTKVDVEGEDFWEFRFDLNNCGADELDLEYTTTLETWATATPPGDASVNVSRTDQLLVVQFRDADFETLIVRLKMTIGL